MYLTDIRGFTAEDYHICSLNELDMMLADNDVPFFAAKADLMCKITIHGMGMRGDKGLVLYFARFCKAYSIDPRFISVSDMGISFFIPALQRDLILDALCEYFPMWA